MKKEVEELAYKLVFAAIFLVFAKLTIDSITGPVFGLPVDKLIGICSIVVVSVIAYTARKEYIAGWNDVVKFAQKKVGFSDKFATVLTDGVVVLSIGVIYRVLVPFIRRLSSDLSNFVALALFIAISLWFMKGSGMYEEFKGKKKEGAAAEN